MILDCSYLACTRHVLLHLLNMRWYAAGHFCHAAPSTTSHPLSRLQTKLWKPLLQRDQSCQALTCFGCSMMRRYGPSAGEKKGKILREERELAPVLVMPVNSDGWEAMPRTPSPSCSQFFLALWELQDGQRSHSLGSGTVFLGFVVGAEREGDGPAHPPE